MPAPSHVSVAVPSLPGSTNGIVTDVWHAVDGVRAEVQFPLDGAPLLPVGRAGELAFYRTETDERVSALGKVAYRGDGDVDRSYHFLFGERTRQALATLLEPRRAFRVHPDPDEPVSITLSVSGAPGTLIGAARDVSESGIGIEVPWEHEAALSKQDIIEIRLRLPGHAEEFLFMSRIRNRSLGTGAIIYGLEFIISGAPEADPGLIEVCKYVAIRSNLAQRSAAEARKSA